MPAGRLFCNTLYPDHRPVLINLRHSSLPLCPQSGQAAGGRWHGANQPPATSPRLPLPSQQALLCPRPWAGGVGRTARTAGGGGHKGKLIVARANSQKPLRTTASEVSFQPPARQGHSGTQSEDSRLAVLMIFNIPTVTAAL